MADLADTTTLPDKRVHLYPKVCNLFHPPPPCTMSSTARSLVGIIGAGKMGTAMTKNFVQAGLSVLAFDPVPEACSAVEAAGAEVASSAVDVAARAPLVITMLPNDAVLESVTKDILPAMPRDSVHVSCSTVSPHTARSLADEHAAAGVRYVGAPVFARPDGVANKSGVFMLSGDKEGISRAVPILETTCHHTESFGDDPGAANVVKLSGNFMIAAAIESIGESLSLAEKNGLDREKVMGLFSSTIFDCLIYKGYGNRVAGRKHFQDVDHPGFALELGLKDVSLVLDTAARSDTPMPIGSLLKDRYVAAKNKGRGDLDWSAIGLSISEDAGVDVRDAAENPRPE